MAIDDLPRGHPLRRFVAAMCSPSGQLFRIARAVHPAKALRKFAVRIRFLGQRCSQTTCARAKGAEKGPKRVRPASVTASRPPPSCAVCSSGWTGASCKRRGPLARRLEGATVALEAGGRRTPAVEPGGGGTLENEEVPHAPGRARFSPRPSKVRYGAKPPLKGHCRLCRRGAGLRHRHEPREELVARAQCSAALPVAQQRRPPGPTRPNSHQTKSKLRLGSSSRSGDRRPSGGRAPSIPRSVRAARRRHRPRRGTRRA